MPSKPQLVRKAFIGVALLLWAMSLMLAALAQDAPASYPEFTIVANAEGITLPEGLTAGFTTLAFQNDTEAAFAPALARFREGKTMEDFMAAMAQGPAGQQAALEAVAVLGNPDAAPGEVERATYNLLAGEYLLVNFAAGGPPTILPFTVADATTDLAAEPEAQAEITLVDYAFAMPGVLGAGEQTWKISNIGDQVHHVLIYSVTDDAELPEVTRAFIDALKAAQPGTAPEFPYEQVYAWGVMTSGETAWPMLDLPAGKYAVICVIGDSTSETMMSHLEHGMIRVVTVE